MRENNDQVMNSSNKQTKCGEKKSESVKMDVLMKSRCVKGQRSKVKALSEEQTSIQILALNLDMFGIAY